MEIRGRFVARALALLSLLIGVSAGAFAQGTPQSGEGGTG